MLARVRSIYQSVVGTVKRSWSWLKKKVVDICWGFRSFFFGSCTLIQALVSGPGVALAFGLFASVTSILWLKILLGLIAILGWLRIIQVVMYLIRY